MKYWDFSDWATAIAVLIVLALILYVAIFDIVNLSNDIDCGTVVDKHIYSYWYRARCIFLPLRAANAVEQSNILSL